MADNEIIKVQFPDKMRVSSPEIDSILQVSERISTWLHKDLKQIIEPLTVLHAVPDLLKEVNSTVVNQFTSLFQGQIEADVINRQATIKGSARQPGMAEWTNRFLLPPPGVFC